MNKMEEPTKAQIKEFWEWCGFREKGTGFVWPDGRFDKAPPTDLNNLFKYAVPNIKDRITRMELLMNWAYKIYTLEEDPALALFWAIRGAIKDD